jgi:hypothetical protein
MAAAEHVDRSEYEQFMALRKQVEDGIASAESEFMLTTWKAVFAVINRRQKSANNLQISLSNKTTHETAKTKREELKAKRKQLEEAAKKREK